MSDSTARATRERDAAAARPVEQPLRVLVLVGSLRRDSYNRRLARAFSEEAPQGLELVEWPRLAELPHYNEDLEDDPPLAAVQLRRAVAAADALLLITPEYNAGPSSAIKNAVDWASRPPGRAPIAGKPAAVAGASVSSFGALWAQQQLRRALLIAGARPLERELPVARVDQRFAGNRLRDAGLRQELRALLEELATAACSQPTTPQATAAARGSTS